MKVDVSVGGIWHSRDIVEALYENNMLNKFYTSRPYYKLKDNFKNIDKKYIKTYGYIDIFQAIAIKLFKNNIQVLKANLFDKVVSNRLDDIDLLIVWSSFGLESIKKVKEKNKNIKVIIERGSTHIREQNKLLKMAHEYYNIDTNREYYVDRRIIKKEEEEYRLADYIMVPSRFVADTFKKNGVNEKKIIIVPYGANIELNKQDIFCEKNFYTESIELLFVGELSIRKGVITAINVVKMAQERGLKINLTLVGKVNEYILPYIKECDEFINIKGVLNSEELKEVYKKSHILILPSIEEGLARVMLESMSYAVPVIATENSGIGDIVKNGVDGFIFDAFDEDRVISILEHMYNDRERLKKVSINAFNKIKNFSKQEYKKKIIDIYKKIIID